MTATLTTRVVPPGAILQFTKQMQLLERQFAQHFAPINNKLLAIDKTGKQFRNYGQQLTRAHAFLVEQYQKTARAKKKKAHAHLVAVCQAVAKQARRLLSLRDVAAQFYTHTTTDTRDWLHVLLSEQHQGNAPNGGDSFVLHTHLEVAATN